MKIICFSLIMLSSPSWIALEFIVTGVQVYCEVMTWQGFPPLEWCHNERHGWLFAQPFVQAHIKGNIKAPCHWPLWGESAGDWWIPLTKNSNAEKVWNWWRHHAHQWPWWVHRPLAPHKVTRIFKGFVVVFVSLDKLINKQSSSRWLKAP